MNRCAWLIVCGMWAAACASASGQELLTNPSFELVFPDNGGPNTAPPGWTIDEGPKVPAAPGPYRGDYNNAGVTTLPCQNYSCNAVDAADYVIWRDKLGQEFDLPNRHPNLGGPINEFDYDVWRAEFGKPSTMDLAQPSNFGHLALEDEWQVWFEPYNGTEANQETNYAHLTQTVPGTPGLKYTMTGYALFEDYFPGGVTNLNAEVSGVPTGAPFNDGPLSPTDTYFALEFLDSGGNVLAGSIEKELRADGQPSNTTWMQHTLVAVAPVGTANVRVRASMINGIYNPLPSPQVFQMSFFVESFSLTAVPGPGAGASVPEPGSITLVLLSGIAMAFRRDRNIR